MIVGGGIPAERLRDGTPADLRAPRTIEAADPALAAHLRDTTESGRRCVCKPDDEVVGRT